MKHLITLCSLFVICFSTMAQAPLKMNYQAVVRDASGNIVVNTQVYVIFEILQGSSTGVPVFTESQYLTTNSFGLFNAVIGESNPGQMAAVDWPSGVHYLRVSVDGTVVSTQQLLSVPYALYSERSNFAFVSDYNNLMNAPANVSYFTNDAGYITSPDDADADPANELQTLSVSGNDLSISGGNTVVIPQTTYTAGSGIGIAGNTITNLAPDQTVVVIGTGATTVTGTYPNFTVNSTDNVNDADANPTNEIQSLSLANNTITLSSGGSVSLSGYVDTLWRQSGSNIYNTNTGKVGVGTNTPPAKLVVQGDASMADTIPLFEVKDRDGHTVFIIDPDSARLYVGDDGAKTSKGAFAVSGRNTAKQPTHDFLWITPDSTRIFTGNDTSGFGVESIETGGSQRYMRLIPDNYFIGHNSGLNNTTGAFNNYLGYETGYLNTVGYYNVFLGYTAGRNNIDGSSNTFLGYAAGWNSNGQSNIAIGMNALGNSNVGQSNVAVGNQALAYNASGVYNVAMGNNALFYNDDGTYNVAMGVEALRGNSSGDRNIAMGYQSMYSNSTGDENVVIGYKSGYANTTGNRNVFLGMESGRNNNDGIYNNFIGYQAGFTNSSGGHNNFIGYQAGYNNTSGWTNTFIGGFAGYNNSTGTQNVCIGSGSGVSNTTGNNNVYIGHNCANANVGGGNVFIGYEAGKTGTYSDRLFIENSNTTTIPLINGDFANDRIAFNRMATTYPLHVGTNNTNGNGAFLTTGGTWTNGSSRSFKDRYTPLNGNEILEKISTMDIMGWYYKETQEYHIGPFAEDFYQAFGTGVLDIKQDLGHYLASSDVAGVSMVAIKELIKQNREQQKEIDELREENKRMKADIENIIKTTTK